MAKYNPLSETDEPIIIYKWKGIQYSRLKGNTGRQAPVAKIQAGILGKASAISAKLRGACKPMLPGPADRTLMYRLNNALQQWLRTEPQTSTEAVNEIPFLKGFCFYGNRYGELFHAAMPVSRRAGGDLTLYIPAFDSPNPISPLPFNGQIRLQVIAASININEPAMTNTYETELDISYTGMAIPAQELLLPLPTGPGNLTVVVVAVNETTAGVVGAMYN